MKSATEQHSKSAGRAVAWLVVSVAAMFVASSVAVASSQGGLERQWWVPLGDTLSAGQVVMKEGAEASYTVHLGRAFADPGSGRSVEVRVVSSDPALVAVDTPVLTFTGGAGGNWDDKLRVRLSAPADSDASYGRATLTNTLVGLGETVDLPSVAVGVNDAQVKRAVIVTPAHVTVNEGGTAEVTVRLATDPGTGWLNGSVHVLPSDPPYDTPFSYQYLKHSPDLFRLIGGPNGNWDTGATVTLTALDDPDTSGDTYGFVFHTNFYRIGETVLNDTVRVTVLDDDSPPGVSVTPQRITLQEGDGGSYQIALNTDPGGDVTVDVHNPDPDRLSVSPAAVTFDDDNPWNGPQSVTVTALTDPAATGSEYQVTHTVSGYGAVTDAPVVSIAVLDSGVEQGIVARVPTVAPQWLSEAHFQYTGPLVEGTETPCVEGEVCVFWWRMALDPVDHIESSYDVYSRTDESDPWGERHITAESSNIEVFVGGSHGDWTDWRLGWYHVPADADKNDTFLEFRIGADRNPTVLYEPNPDAHLEDEPPTRSYAAYNQYTLTVTAVAVDPDKLSDQDDDPGDGGTGFYESQSSGTTFEPDAELLADVGVAITASRKANARKRLKKVLAGMTGIGVGYTAEECRATARKHRVRSKWKPWCNEIERRENAEAAADTLEQRIRQRLNTAETDSSRKLWKRALATIGAADGKALTKQQIKRYIQNHERAGRSELAQLWRDIRDAAYN